MSGWGSSRVVATAFITGLVAGVLVWSMQIRSSRRALFGRSPVRRLAALGHLAGQRGVESAQLLAEYVRWETQPMLRRRAERILSRMERHLA